MHYIPNHWYYFQQNLQFPKLGKYVTCSDISPYKEAILTTCDGKEIDPSELGIYHHVSECASCECSKCKPQQLPPI
jgi:hypothetical protein